MYVPSYVHDGSTDPHNPPQLVRIIPRRKPPGGTVWALTLEHEHDDSFESSCIPPTFRKDADDIMAAYAGTGPAYNRVIGHLKEVQVAMHARVNSVRETFLENAVARVKSVRLTASKGAARVLALLEVDAPVELAEAIVRALDSDVDVDVVVDGELPFDRNREPTDEDEEVDEDEEQETETSEPAPEPARATGRGRRRKVEELPPEPIATIGTEGEA